MTIWLLALVLLASLSALGFRQGAIRVAFSLIGILLGALLAAPLGRMIKPLLMAVGIKSPILLWALGPLIIFILISIIFKVAALAAHQKMDVFYKYKAGDLRLALWERLNHRLGLCLGLLNGTAYLILISLVAYSFSYWTVQMATADTDPKSVRILNRLGNDLENTGFIKVAQAIAPMPGSFYDTADVTGVVYNNPLSEARLARYPGFLGLAERPEFQALAGDKEFSEMRQRRDPVMNLINSGPIQAILNNRELLQTIWATVIPDLKDLQEFLKHGKSPKYEHEMILGRWNFEVNLATAAMRRTKPNISASEMQKLKKWMVAAFPKTSFVAMTDGQAILKNVPPLKAAPAAAQASGPQTLQGRWKSLDGGKYQLSFETEEFPARVEGDRLAISATIMELAFSREN